ncbi:MAG: cardiolipin synthase [Lactobacillus sp.]|nr:cardiolipin synthase [Lactobacillus sp.]
MHKIVLLLIILNTIWSIVVVFRRRRSISTNWGWLVVLIALPIVGTILYSFLGRGLSQKKLFAINKQKHIGLRNVKKTIQKSPKESSPNDTSHDAQMLTKLLNKLGDAPLTKNNDVKFYTDGPAMFADLFKDIEDAQETVNLEFYSFYKDDLGNQLLDLLIKKAEAGVKIRLIYDVWGSLGANRRWFNKLRRAGGQVIPFITSRNSFTRYRFNYHLHRKIVVIDGKISWTGGFNVGDQYVGKKKRYGYWRDSQIRIVGSASLVLQERFVMDWNASVTSNNDVITFNETLFPVLSQKYGNTALQVVNDGPDVFDPNLRNGMIKLMMSATKRLWIQTPYLVPDSALIATWQIAAKSGVDVRIMIPCKPDHAFIYRATQWYAHELARYGITIYTYDPGFLHAKTVIVDDKYATIGSVNQDIRSYHLNFEDNVFVYDREFNKKMAEAFANDLKTSTKLTIKDFENQPYHLKIMQAISRMLAPIL